MKQLKPMILFSLLIGYTFSASSNNTPGIITQNTRPDIPTIIHSIDQNLLNRGFQGNQETPSYSIELPGNIYAAPPSGPVRNVAEFEPSEGTLIRFALGIPVSMVKELAQDAKVWCLVSSSEESSAQSSFQSAGVTMSNVTFISTTTDSYWTRDYGPWWIIDGTGTFGIIDFKYNRPRPKDDATTVPVGKSLNNTVYTMGLTTAGGNYMCDGYGIGASTKLITKESNQSESQVAAIKKQYLGITKFLCPDDPLLGSSIDHIDCWSKFLSPDKILIKQVPQGNSDYASLEKAVDFWKQQTSSYGTPYKIYRVTGTAGNEAYTNSYICNGKVFVPTAGTANDEKALEVYRKAMPGYTILGIPAGPAAWQNTDAIHCRTHEMADRGMLYVSHIPKSGSVEDNGSGIPVEVTIIPYSKKSLVADSCVIYHRKKGYASSEFKAVKLQSVSNNKYKATIPSIFSSDSIQYFVHAKDESGRRENQPYMGASDPFTFYCKFTGTGINAVISSNTQPQCWSSYDPSRNCYRICWNTALISSAAQLVIYNLQGKEIQRWTLSANQTSLNWNGSDGRGIRMAKGLYLCSFITPTKSITHQISLIK